MDKITLTLFFIFVLFSVTTFGQSSTPIKGSLLNEKLRSEILKENRIGITPERNVKIYLPPSYSSSKKMYPVLYYLHNAFWNPEKMFADGNVVRLIEKAFLNKVVNEFILVVADYSTPTTGCIYENSPVSGRWLDFTVNELIPFIDTRFRTIPNRDSRGITGDFFGGRGALKLAMIHSDMFSVVYALHPVATGTGQLPWPYVNVNWKKTHEAKSFTDLGSDPRVQLFVTISQAYIPNLNRPPFYCDFYTEMENGVPKYNPVNARKIKDGFLLDHTLEACAENLRTMHGIDFDWGRFDETYAHVYSNREFSLKLEDLAIEHEAEEYRGNPWNKTWTDDGRFYNRVLPFFNRHLIFDQTNELNATK